MGDPNNDWLRLDIRRVQNPTLCVSNNQVVGCALISADRNRRCCTALAESEIRLWWWPRYVSSMKYPKRCQYKHAKQKKYHVRNWAEYNEGLRRRGDLTVWFDEGDVPAAVEFGRVAAAPVNTLRQQPHRCQEISVCF